MFKQVVFAFFVGALFAVGLGVSGMTQPEKVIGFLDIAGDWDPSLAWVMVGAIGTFGLIHVFVKEREKPVLAADWSHIPKVGADLTTRAKLGNVLFGVGWGLAGYCPGPAFVSLTGGQASAYAFVAAMFVGFLLSDGVSRLLQAAARKSSMSQ